MLEAIVTEKRFQMSFEYSALRVAKHTQSGAPCGWPESRRNLVSRIRLAKSIGDIDRRVSHQRSRLGGGGKRTLAARSCGGRYGRTCAHYCA